VRLVNAVELRARAGDGVRLRQRAEVSVRIDDRGDRMIVERAPDG
jgi:hypothetical protein